MSRVYKGALSPTRSRRHKKTLSPTMFLRYAGKRYADTIKEYLEHPETFVEEYTVTINGKRRSIVTYQANERGGRLRNIHRMFSYVVQRLHKPASSSYAYQKGKNVKACLQNHLNNDVFLKTDIHACFDSINFDLLAETLLSKCNVNTRVQEDLLRALKSCFYHGRLPIGFIASPILSDLYLNCVDKELELSDGVCYTRYADDFILSASGEGAQEKLQRSLEDIQAKMSALKLTLNQKKTYFRFLRQPGDAIHVLGLNLVRRENGVNEITVSDRYIRKTCMELCQLIQEKSVLEPWEAHKRFYSVNGKVNYIVYASERSAKKLQKMIWAKTGLQLELNYWSLAAVCVPNPESIQQDIQACILEGFVHYFIHHKHINILPECGQVWESAYVPLASQSEQLTRREIQELLKLKLRHELLKRPITMQQEKSLAYFNSNPDAVNAATNRWQTLAGLKYYLISLCHAVEGKQPATVTLKYAQLSVGNETFVMRTPDDVSLFRELALKIRDTKLSVTYRAAYSYQNPTGESPNKQNGKYVKKRYRPLYLSLSNKTSCEKNCAVFDSEIQDWFFVSNPIGEKARLQEKALSAIDLSQNDFRWQGKLDMCVSWPLHTGESDAIEIYRQLFQLIEDCGGSLPEEGVRTYQGSWDLMLSSSGLGNLLEQLKSLSILVKEIEGKIKLHGWFIPERYMECDDQQCFHYVGMDISDSGKLRIGGFSF